MKLDFETRSALEHKLHLATTEVAVWEKAWHETHNYLFLEAENMALKEQHELHQALRQ